MVVRERTSSLTQIPDLFKQHHKMLNKPNNSAYSQFNHCEENALFRILMSGLVAELFDVKVDEFLIFASFSQSEQPAASTDVFQKTRLVACLGNAS